MKAILIDSLQQTVTEVEVESLEDWQRNVGGELGSVYVQPLYYPALPGHVLLVDEDARVRATPLAYGFSFRGTPAIVGNALILRQGSPDFGPAVLPLDAVQKLVKFWGHETVPTGAHRH